MREFYEIINEYPWTTFFIWWMIITVVYTAIIATKFNNKN